jgi:predicted O-methyltransferase YrrM
MAVSLETAGLLLALCRTQGVCSAIDLGSGFSSYVLHRWASEVQAEVVSVDDDPAWLERTRRFLSQQGISAEGLCLWPDIPNRMFDLVFHDFAVGAKREQTMPVALGVARRLVVFDDAQHRGHRAAMRSAAADAGAQLFSLRRLTVDARRRYAMLAVK